MSKKIETNNLERLVTCLAHVEDPRVQGRSKHLFIDILVISICAMLCGAETCTEIELFGEQKQDWLKQYLELPCGIPSHDTIGRVLSLIDPLQMEAAFTHWVQTILNENELTKRISLDGKSISGTERRFPRHPLHMVSAYSHELGLSLTQTQAEGCGSGEIAGALECLKVLDIKDVTVMVDAGMAVKRIVDQVRVQKGHYLVPIKGNQRFALKEIEQAFIKAPNIQIAKTAETSHGRREQRECELILASAMSEHFHERWPDVKVIFKVRRRRQSDDKWFNPAVTASTANFVYKKDARSTKEIESTTYYLSSRKYLAKEALKEVRKHWGIENGLHWVLDVAFGEDQWKVREKSLARSLSLIRKIALNIIRRSKTKGSMSGRIKAAAWNNDFLDQLVFGT